MTDTTNQNQKMCCGTCKKFSPSGFENDLGVCNLNCFEPEVQISCAVCTEWDSKNENR